jgi:hypothetical protein
VGSFLILLVLLNEASICSKEKKRKKKEKKIDNITSLTKGGRKNKTPLFSAGQWPSLACKAEKKWMTLRNAVVAFSYVISSPSSTFTWGIVCLKFFSARNCNHFDKEISILEYNF